MRVLSWMPAKRLIASYIFDWIVIIAIAAIGGGFALSSPYKRPFSIVDLSLQYPYIENENIPTWLLIVVSLVAPAAIIFLVCLILVPGPNISRATPRSQIWRRKLWEWNTGWMGLGLSLAIAFMFTQGMKNLFGKPRPNMMAACEPDIANFEQYRVSTFSSGFNPEWVLVSADICQQSDSGKLDEGFRSFPSGHSSMSWSGLLYLAFFLASKFAVGVPFLPPKRIIPDHPTGLDAYLGSDSHSILPTTHSKEESTDMSGQTMGPSRVPPRNQAAAPPVYLLALPVVPICTAIYITSTRYFQFFHHGFDMLFGSFIGIASAYFAFRYYHLPISQGAGWSWGARSRDRAWAIGVGVPGYVGTEGWTSKRKATATNGDHVQQPVEDEPAVATAV